MGAWGTELQSGDIALDVIASSKVRRIQQEKDKRSLRKYLTEIKSKYGSNWSVGVLGVVEHLLDKGMPHTFFDTCRPIIDAAIDAEKQPDRLATWFDPESRKKVLCSLKKRLQGKKVD